MSRCIGEPISWLVLERYGLGELSSGERERVAEHLSACAACQACWARIGADGARELPPLPRPGTIAGRRRARVSWPWLGALAAAAAAVLIVWQGGGPGLEPPAATKNVKGGELAIELVRLGAAGELSEPTHYRADDRFKVLFTCPPPWRGTVQVVVYQDGRAYFPLDDERIEVCGNRLRLAGALRLDGASPVLVCVATSAGVLDRARLARGIEALPEGSVCERLEPAPGK